jgi:glucosyl-3-phosphoglycerate synthase
MNKQLYTKVEKWLQTHTFHHELFSDLGQLVEKKQQQGKKISVAIPTLNEEATIGNIVKTIRKDLMKTCPLVDEIVVVDSGSEDRTKTIAEKAGARFHYCSRTSHLPASEVPGKGSNLWVSLHLTTGDIVSWVDGDIRNFHSKFVYGPVGVLLEYEGIKYVKSFYKRPLVGEQSRKSHHRDFSRLGGGRVTELCFRPLMNKYFPELAGLIQPLSGEFAGRREVLEKVPFYSGYGVETGLLISILQKSGLDSIAQIDLDIRIHRNQDLANLRNMASIVSEIILGEARKQKRKPKLDGKLYVPTYVMGQTKLEEIPLKDTAWPALLNIPYYKAKRNLDKVETTSPL